MKMKKAIAVGALVFFVLGLSACAVVPVSDAAPGVPVKPKTAKQIKYEQEEDTRSMFVKGISSFAGVVVGGIAGLLLARDKNVVTSAAGGCVAGGVLGFGLGIILFDNTKPTEGKADDRKVKEYFQDYRNIQLKE